MLMPLSMGEVMLLAQWVCYATIFSFDNSDVQDSLPSPRLIPFFITHVLCPMYAWQNIILTQFLNFFNFLSEWCYNGEIFGCRRVPHVWPGRRSKPSKRALKLFTTTCWALRSKTLKSRFLPSFCLSVYRHVQFIVVQGVLVGTGICTARGMEQTQQHWALLCLRMGWAVGPVMRSSAWMIQSGAYPARSRSRPRISARRGVGVTLRTSILISPSLSSSTLLSTELGLSLWLSEGMSITLIWW